MALRYLCLVIDFFCFIGVIHIFWNVRGQCIADRICNTVVLCDEKIRADWTTMHEKATGQRDPMP